MSEIRNALSRKFGPLPAWAWAAIGLAAVFAYRAVRGQYTTTTTDTSGTDTDTTPAERADPLTLGAGESVYDPNTGQLIGTAPEQQTAEPVDNSPITLKPGEGIYDPGTGKLITLPGRGKRKPKPKPHHKPKPKPKPHKPHGHGVVRKPVKRVKQKVSKVTKRVRARQVYHPAKMKPAPAHARIRAATRPTTALKQRVAATHPKPHAAAQAHPKATPKPKPKRRR